MIKNHYVDRFGVAGCHSFLTLKYCVGWSCVIKCRCTTLYGTARPISIIETHLAFMV